MTSMGVLNSTPLTMWFIQNVMTSMGVLNSTLPTMWLIQSFPVVVES